MFAFALCKCGVNVLIAWLSVALVTACCSDINPCFPTPRGPRSGPHTIGLPWLHDAGRRRATDGETRPGVHPEPERQPGVPPDQTRIQVLRKYHWQQHFSILRYFNFN